MSVNPYDAPIRNYSYERRNKLLSACAEGVLVISAGEKSGALTTASYGQALKKPVFALPYPPDDVTGAGCNALIKKGAYLTENLIDISSHFGINLKEQNFSVSMTEEERKVYEHLLARGETHVSELARTLSLPPFKATALLSKMEVKGLVVPVGGNKYLAK